MENKVILGVGVIVVIVLALVVIFSQSTPTGAFALGTNNPLAIGAVLSLTGKAASYGHDIQNGMELAFYDINKSGKPLNVKLLYDDTTSVPEKAVTSVQKFIGFDGAKVIIGVGADEVLAMVPITEESKVILATPIAGSDKVDGAGKYVFRNRESSKFTAYSLAELLNAKGYNRVALFVASSSASPISYQKSFLEKFQSFGGSAESFSYAESSPDVRTSIAKVKELDINAVYVIAGKDSDGAEVIRQLKEMGFDGLIVGGPALETTKFFESTKGSAEGVVIAVAPVDSSAPNATQVLEEYKSTYGKEMSFSAANAYDLVMLLNSASGKCDSNTDCIREYLLSVKDYPGLGGKTSFNPNGGVSKVMSYKIANEGKFVPYKAS
ncbi:MAG: ABC transporter substrate-binding protein [archaeon]|jgi:branched-chain amino acid transport system substrate-binding protein